mmetsp:Transcript_3196/g.7685  ORF Transcript_3196/g.7685 Transcript_3196/m.7685 type:complete len:223 (-) Transcript_3196:142-810(-)
MLVKRHGLNLRAGPSGDSFGSNLTGSIHKLLAMSLGDRNQILQLQLQLRRRKRRAAVDRGATGLGIDLDLAHDTNIHLSSSLLMQDSVRNLPPSLALVDQHIGPHDCASDSRLLHCLRGFLPRLLLHLIQRSYPRSFVLAQQQVRIGVARCREHGVQESLVEENPLSASQCFSDNLGLLVVLYRVVEPSRRQHEQRTSTSGPPLEQEAIAETWAPQEGSCLP